jgi:hypothetical protein
MSLENRPRVIVCGSRTFWDGRLMFRKLDKILAKLKRPIIVSGGQSGETWHRKKRIKTGADYWGEQWAYAHWHTVKLFPADWEKHGKAAGMIRNKEMVLWAAERKPAYCVAMWDGKSPGTLNTINLARKYGLSTIIVRFDPTREL